MAADGRFQRVRWAFFPAPSVVPGGGAGASRPRARARSAEPADGALMAAPARPSRASDPAAATAAASTSAAPVRWRHRSPRRPPSRRPASPAARTRTGPGLLRGWPASPRPSSSAGHRHRPEAHAPDGHQRDGQRARDRNRREQQRATGDQQARAHQRGPQVPAHGDAGVEVAGTTRCSTVPLRAGVTGPAELVAWPPRR